MDEEKKVTVDDEINELLKVMSRLNPFSNEYGICLENLKALYTIKNGLKEPEKKSVSPDTLVMVAANLIGIVLILNYEQLHASYSKAMNMLFKAH